MGRSSHAAIPADLRPRLEAARLDLLALFRALDRMDLTPSEIPQRLFRQLFERDADYVEALWGSISRPGAIPTTLKHPTPRGSAKSLQICAIIDQWGF